MTVRNGHGHRAYRRKQAALKRRTSAEGLPCYWCGKPIDTSLPYNDPHAFTADHPEAIANGGHLTRQELRPMHRRCNSVKGDHEPTEIWGAS